MTKSTKSYQRGRLLGSQTPSDRICPDYEYTDGEDATKILAISGLVVDPWQSEVLNDWMGRNEVGEWSAQTCGLSVPRQNGKTCIVSGRSIAGMILYNEWVIYTAHLQKTATETFMEIKGMFETSGLNKYVKEIKNALGREQIILKNGGRMMFVARTRNGGRGLHGDVAIFDEAQELTPEQQASFLPALSASKNPQTIYLGTPPDENCDGTVFRGIRKKSKEGQSNLIAWTEFSVNEIGDVTSPKRWAETNPALGRRIKQSTIAAECEQMSKDTFARERLGWWSERVIKIDYAIDHEKWDACASDDLKPEGKTAYGVKFSADGSEVCLCGAVIDASGCFRISEIERKELTEGTRWLAEWLNQRYTKACCVVIDGKNGTEILIDRIADVWKAKNSIVRPRANDVIASASILIDAINENKLSWYRLQEDLDDSAKTATKRPISGGFGFGGENPIPIEACSLAMYGVKTSKRDPSKKMRIG